MSTLFGIVEGDSRETITRKILNGDPREWTIPFVAPVKRWNKRERQYDCGVVFADQLGQVIRCNVAQLPHTNDSGARMSYAEMFALTRQTYQIDDCGNDIVDSGWIID